MQCSQAVRPAAGLFISTGRAAIQKPRGFQIPAAISELTPSCISPKQKYISGGSYVCLLLTLAH